MIAQRFRPVAWVIGCAVAATALYTVSLRVASERARLDAIDLKIAMTRRNIRQLQTEMGTRASLRQLERWNGESLALSAPHANQFLPNETQINKIDGARLPSDGFSSPPLMVEAAKRPGSAAEGAKVDPLVIMTPATSTVALLDPTLPARATAADTEASRDKPKAKKATP
jgi:hypothetical protein